MPGVEIARTHCAADGHLSCFFRECDGVVVLTRPVWRCPLGGLDSFDSVNTGRRRRPMAMQLSADPKAGTDISILQVLDWAKGLHSPTSAIPSPVGSYTRLPRSRSPLLIFQVEIWTVRKFLDRTEQPPLKIAMLPEMRRQEGKKRREDRTISPVVKSGCH